MCTFDIVVTKGNVPMNMQASAGLRTWKDEAFICI